jgi:hypothetical protein
MRLRCNVAPSYCIFILAGFLPQRTTLALGTLK